MIEQIQQDVTHLRLHVERQEQDVEESVADSSMQALTLEARLSIVSYQLPLRRHLRETESLLDP
jgi:hypothetical protein